MEKCAFYYGIRAVAILFSALLFFFFLSTMSSENNFTDPMSVTPPTPAVSFPYAIHHSDSPSTILVTPLLTGDNYGTWNRAITMALRAKNKVGFVNGSLPKPETENEIQNWECYND